MGEGARRDDDVLQVEQVGVLRGRDHTPGRVDQHRPVPASAGVGIGVAVVAVVPAEDVLAAAAVEDLAVMVDGVVAVGENRQDPAVAQRPAGEDAEAVIGGGTGEIHEDEVGEVGGVGGVGELAGSGRGERDPNRTGRGRVGGETGSTGALVLAVTAEAAGWSRISAAQ